MNDQEINIAIAEACGWKDISSGWHGDLNKVMGVKPNYPDYPNPAHYDIPDYCHDLNAMHEVEKALTENIALVYEAILHGIVLKEESKTWCAIWHATARQRAEAFLRTIGKWRDS